MTTTTVPDVDLEQWLAGEIEIPCEVHHRDAGNECGAPADWLMYMRRECGCPGRSQGFACDMHHEETVRQVVPLLCAWCQSCVIRITFTERIR